MTGNRSINRIKFLISLVHIVFFCFVIVYADKFYKGTDPLVVNPSFVQLGDKESDGINIDMISVKVNAKDEGVIQYVVQPGDSLSKIASKFGITVSHLKKINSVNSDDAIHPGDKLVVTSDEEGFLYTIPDKTNIVVFANKYNLNVQDLMSLNYIQDETEILYPGQEIFVNITKEQAYNVGLLERPKVTPQIIATAPRPVINKPTKPKNNYTNTQTKTVTYDNNASDLGSRGDIISQWTFTKQIRNKFYPGYCTWYAAIISPEIFPYIDDNTQDRSFGGDAREWCTNAKAAGFTVNKKPRVGALVVYSRGGRDSQAGHVAKVVKYYPDDGKMVIRDMNYVAKFVVTERRDDTDNANIKCYISK